MPALPALPAAKRRGASILELLAVLGIGAITAGLAAETLGCLARTTTTETARLRVALFLLEARRQAYTTAATVGVRGAGQRLEFSAAGSRPRALSMPRGTLVSSTVAPQDVRFFASGMADNATLTVRSIATGQERPVIVNQRGLVR